ncbi:MAG: segregation/condensation protein A [Clostridiaceae bacterium]|nr:segregation/condensation protein A [Clostridiaceae bacterium]
MEDVTFHLEVFEGPLDLLLYLLSKNKIDIKDIPISLILEQYIDYLAKMHEMDIEVTGEFITMASQLVYIKSKMLIPVYKEDEADDPRAALIETLLDYQRVKQVGGMLMGRFELGRDIFTKSPEPLMCDEEQLYGNTLRQLQKAVVNILEREGRKLPPPVESFSGIVGRETVSVSDKITFLLEKFKNQETIDFSDAVLSSKTRSEVVAVFLAVLELSKTKKLLIDENEGKYILKLSGEEDGTE